MAACTHLGCVTHRQHQDRWSALGIASYGGHEKTVRVLLDHAADPNLRLSAVSSPKSSSLAHKERESY